MLYMAWLRGLLFLSTKPRLCEEERQTRLSDTRLARNLLARVGPARSDG